MQVVSSRKHKIICPKVCEEGVSMYRAGSADVAQTIQGASKVANGGQGTLDKLAEYLLWSSCVQVWYL